MKKKRKKINIEIKRGFLLFFCFIIIGVSMGTFLLYGPWGGFRNLLITTAMTTKSHHYLATWFYSNEEIERVLAYNKMVEVNEDTNSDLIDFKDNVDESQIDEFLLGEFVKISFRMEIGDLVDSEIMQMYPV